MYDEFKIIRGSEESCAEALNKLRKDYIVNTHGFTVDRNGLTYSLVILVHIFKLEASK